MEKKIWEKTTQHSKVSDDKYVCITGHSTGVVYNILDNTYFLIKFEGDTWRKVSEDLDYSFLEPQILQLKNLVTHLK